MKVETGRKIMECVVDPMRVPAQWPGEKLEAALDLGCLRLQIDGGRQQIPDRRNR
jgi:hypothetical protein